VLLTLRALLKRNPIFLPVRDFYPHFFTFSLESTSAESIKMKVIGSTCALKSKVGGEDMVRCLSDQSLAITKCKIPLLDEQMTVFLQDMNSCYSKLKELVPTLPTNKKASKVEILQHVIDYIWDLQVELDEPEMIRQHPASIVPRTPLTTLNAELASIAVENGCSDDRIMCR